MGNAGISYIHRWEVVCVRCHSVLTVLYLLLLSTWVDLGIMGMPSVLLGFRFVQVSS